MSNLTDSARGYGLTDGDVQPNYRIGYGPAWRAWCSLSNAQRTLANTLMDGGLAASKAMAQARKMVD